MVNKKRTTKNIVYRLLWTKLFLDAFDGEYQKSDDDDDKEKVREVFIYIGLKTICRGKSH